METLKYSLYLHNDKKKKIMLLICTWLGCYYALVQLIQARNMFEDKIYVAGFVFVLNADNILLRYSIMYI